MLKEYNSKPTTVLACRIEEGGTIAKLKKTDMYEYKHKGKGATTTLLQFTASKEPAEGDYIMQFRKGEYYHHPEDVFNSMYITKGMTIL